MTLFQSRAKSLSKKISSWPRRKFRLILNLAPISVHSVCWEQEKGPGIKGSLSQQELLSGLADILTQCANGNETESCGDREANLTVPLTCLTYEYFFSQFKETD